MILVLFQMDMGSPLHMVKLNPFRIFKNIYFIQIVKETPLKIIRFSF